MTTPKLALTDTTAASAVADAVVIGTVQGTDGLRLAPGAEQLDEAFGGGLIDTLALLGATGKADEVVKLPTGGAVAAPVLVAVGLGKPNSVGGVSAEQARRASGAAARALTGVGTAVSTLSAVDLGAAAEGSALGAYAFTRYQTRSDDGGRPLGRVELLVPSAKDRAAVAELKRAAVVAEGVAGARDLVNTPPNDLYPASFAERAAELAGKAGMEAEVLDDKALRRRGFGGVLGVGQGSSRPPRLVRLHYRPPSPRAKVALIGKGVTFDTGGISIKPAPDMDVMTSDMAGGAAVVLAGVTAARLKLPVEVIVTVPMVENMPSGTAYRPGDVLTMYGGRTVEVLNTDAEGRLILADAIVRACEDQPDYLIETSTLTGGQMVALGNRLAGVMGEERLRDRVTGHAKATGEGGWAMPLPEELRAELDSKIADIANITGHRWASMLTAGVFLQEFVADGLPWAHIDVAGPAYNTGTAYGYTGKGGTGVPVRTLCAVLADIADNG
ncbi:MAG TPA: leucyl aminopeptidase [Pseudonocardiaceae bacterium]